MSPSKLTTLAALALASLLTASGQAFAGVNFVAPGIAGSVTNLTVGAQVYDVAFVANVTHANWANQLDFSTEAQAEAAVTALAAALNAAGATNTRYTLPNGNPFDITTGHLWYAADLTSLYGETLIYSSSTWKLAFPFPGGSTAPINNAFPFALDFTLVSPSAWTDLGSGLAGVSGIPSFVGTGTLVASSATTLALTSAKPSSLAVLFVSLASTPVPFKGGVFVPNPALLSIGLGTDGAGSLTLPLAWPTGIPAATSLWFQYAISDPAAVQNVSLSNALKAITP